MVAFSQGVAQLLDVRLPTHIQFMTAEEHRQQVRKRLESMWKCTTESSDHPELHTAALYDMGVLLSHLSEISEISGVRLEKQTDMLILLTRRLYWLTIVLVLFAAFDVAEIIFKFFETF